MDCAKAVLEAKYNYRAAVQEAKTIRGNQLQELEIAYLRALGKNMAVRSSQSATLHREHVRLMQELEEQALREERKSHHDFLSVCQAILCHAPQPLKENLTTSYNILLGWSPPSFPICSTCQDTPGRETAIHGCLSQASTQMVPTAKKVASFARATGENVYR